MVLRDEVKIGAGVRSGVVQCVHAMTCTVNEPSPIARFTVKKTKSSGVLSTRTRNIKVNFESSETWHAAIRPGKHEWCGLSHPSKALTVRIEELKESILSKGEHRFRLINWQFGHDKLSYRGLVKSSFQLVTLFELLNLWIV